MSRVLSGIVATAALSGALALGCSAEGDTPGLVVTPGMFESVPVDAYGEDPLSPGKGAMRKPPEGTVPQGWDVFPYKPGPAEAARAGSEVANPLHATPSDLARGNWAFTTFCQVCHGAGGQGDGPIIGRYPNPPSLLADHAKGLPDGQLFHVVTHGQGIMPAYEVQIRPADRWRIVLYVRSLQGAGADKAAPPPAKEPSP